MSDSPTHTNIFDDLEIDKSGFLDSPEGMERFAENVLAVAKKLEEILDGGSNVGKIEDQAKKEFAANPKHNQELQTLFAEPLALMYESCENLPLAVVYGLATELERLQKDLMNTLHSRAVEESVSDAEPLHNKKLAQIQHKRLRETWESVRHMAKLIYGLEFPRIRARSGNYAVAMTDTVVYSFPGDEDIYYSPYAVAKRLGIWYKGIKYMDIVEYCEKNPDQVSMKKVQL